MHKNALRTLDVSYQVPYYCVIKKTKHCRLRRKENKSMDVCDCEHCKNLEKFETETKDEYFQYRKKISHWIWHEKGHFLLDPFCRKEGDPSDYATITMSKWSYVDDGRIVTLTWFEEHKWKLTLLINGEKKEEEIVIIPDNISETLDVNPFMNICCRWMQVYRMK